MEYILHFLFISEMSTRKNIPTVYTVTDDESVINSSIALASSVVILSITTNVNGSLFNKFPSTPCRTLDVVNNDISAIEYRRNESGSTMPIPAGSSRSIMGITDANQISIRRVDQSNIILTINAEAINI